MIGRLRQHAPADVLSQVQRLNASGILRFRDNQAIRQIFIDQGGMIRFAVSDVPAESMTGLFKQEMGLTEDQMRQAAADKRGEELLGTTLVRLKFTTPDGLARLTVNHIRRVLRAALGMSEGAYEFQRGELPFRDQMTGGISTAELLLEWSRGIHDLAWLRRRLGSADVQLQKAAQPPEGFQNVPLDANEGYTMSRVDGSTTLGEICMVSPLGEEVTLRALLGLVLAGILEIPAGDLPASPPPASPSVQKPAPVAPSRTGPSAQPATARGRAPRGSRRTAGTPVRPPAAKSTPPVNSSPAPAPVVQPADATGPGVPPAQTQGPTRPPQVAGLTERVDPTQISPLEAEMLDRYDQMRQRSLYDVLGVSPKDSPEVMRKAYYALARKFHPDKFIREDLKSRAEQVFGHITEAYSTLSGAETRQKYDEDLALRSGHHHKQKSVDPPELARLNFKRGKALFDKGQFGEAFQFFENACDQDPSRAEYFQYLALTQARNPRWKKQAEQSFLKAIELSPSNADMYAQLGSLYARGGLRSKAQAMYRKALQWDTTNEEALKGLSPEDSGRKGILGILGRK